MNYNQHLNKLVREAKEEALEYRYHRTRETFVEKFGGEQWYRNKDGD